jgi:hypothetical protein
MMTQTDLPRWCLSSKDALALGYGVCSDHVLLLVDIHIDRARVLATMAGIDGNPVDRVHYLIQQDLDRLTDKPVQERPLKAKLHSRLPGT